jgi:TRAP-type mannitol/chloroaromatic compound transport system permease small subunit
MPAREIAQMQLAEILRAAGKLADCLDRAVSGLSLLFGRVALPLIVALGTGQVLGRHLRIGVASDLKELESVLFLGLVMLSIGYAYLRDAHVRVDLASRRFPARLRAAIEIAGCVGVLIPFCCVLLWYGGDAAWRSFLQGERLPVGDLPLQWLVRMAVPLGGLLLLAAGAAVALRCLPILAADRAAGGARS